MSHPDDDADGTPWADQYSGRDYEQMCVDAADKEARWGVEFEPRGRR